MVAQIITAVHRDL